MPFEERHILFYLNEIYDILVTEKASVKKFIPFRLRDFTITEVAHTSRINKQFVSHRSQYESVMDIPTDQPATLFYGIHKTMMKEKNAGFFIPDTVLMEILTETCIKNGIRLPKVSNRRIYADNLKVGLRMELSSVSIELED